MIPKLPTRPGREATDEDRRHAMADLIEQVVQSRCERLHEGGITEADLFALRRMAAACRRGWISGKDQCTLNRHLPKLDRLRLE